MGGLQISWKREKENLKYNNLNFFVEQYNKLPQYSIYYKLKKRNKYSNKIILLLFF